jgi:hypothetical protein
MKAIREDKKEVIYSIHLWVEVQAQMTIIAKELL